MGASTYKRYTNIDVLKIQKQNIDNIQMVNIIRQISHPTMVAGLLNEVFYIDEDIPDMISLLPYYELKDEEEE